LANLQPWIADDRAKRVIEIIELSNIVLGNEDLKIEAEYLNETIGRHGMERKGKNFVVVPKQTNCLSKIKYNPQS
jgi:hypothetical protein